MQLIRGAIRPERRVANLEHHWIRRERAYGRRFGDQPGRAPSVAGQKTAGALQCEELVCPPLRFLGEMRIEFASNSARGGGIEDAGDDNASVTREALNDVFRARAGFERRYRCDRRILPG
jgi:hypothetical protein